MAGWRGRRQWRRRGPHRIRGELLRQPDRHDRGREARRGARKRAAERAPRANCRARSRSQTQSSPTSTSRQASPSERWMALAAQGAGVQRLLWASTSTKNPRYRELMYVEELIGPDTVDTVPPATFDAFRRHGRAAREPRGGRRGGAGHACRARRARDLPRGDHRPADRRRRGSLRPGLPEAVCGDRRRAGATRGRCTFPARGPAAGDRDRGPRHDRRLAVRGQRWGASGPATARCGQGRTSRSWLGWLHVAEDQLAHSERLDRIARDVAGAGFEHVLLLGMGGSSLCPELLSRTFPRGEGHPQLRILDSTDPAQVSARERELDLARSVFIVSSKSGTTLEPDIFERVLLRAHAGTPSARGGAETLHRDHRSRLQARADWPRSGLSPRRPRPRVDRRAVLRPVGLRHGAGRRDGPRRAGAARPCRAHGAQLRVLRPRARQPGARAGSIIGVCARRGRDKLTLVASPAIADLGAWLEQLLAESTGKDGRGVIPIDREPLGRRRSTATTGCSSTSGSASSPDDARTLPWTRSSMPATP